MTRPTPEEIEGEPALRAVLAICHVMEDTEHWSADTLDEIAAVLIREHFGSGEFGDFHTVGECTHLECREPHTHECDECDRPVCNAHSRAVDITTEVDGDIQYTERKLCVQCQ